MMQYIPIAMAPPGGGEGGGGMGCQQGEGKGGMGGMLIPLILMFGVFYFLLIRPQQKRQKDHKKLVSELQKGDRVVTTGGIHGVISNVKETTIIVKAADNVKLEISRGNITTVARKSEE